MFQIIKPLLVDLGRSMSLMEGQLTALLTLTVYIAMSAATIGVLYWSIKPYMPLDSEWFRVKVQEKWWLWGVGGYVVAIPLVIGVSIGNEYLWQGRGGSNPLLKIVLEEGNGLALGMFFFTAAIAAPVFEEILFRGFILPSLTRYTSTWGAIALSSLLFALAHLSVSEVLPLMTLGCVLGIVYTRSKNLLAPMMVHSLWNSATMVGLLVLGSSMK
ncbi:MAG: CPBP family intramembrane metalloprotease [Merismopedia sp. SIO2A8]|nr:CPBP family intramembrane metalloprotease [Merismopedia sp. SIO2A8]